MDSVRDHAVTQLSVSFQFIVLFLCFAQHEAITGSSVR